MTAVQAPLLTYRASGNAPVLIAFAMIIAWAVVVTFGAVFMPWTTSGSIWIWLSRLALIALETHLYAGLFIVAHESMHRLAAPGRPRLNNLLGRAALFLYGGFRLAPLLVAHGDHHTFPASERDPDWSAKGPALWFVGFILRHSTVVNIFYFALIDLLLFTVGRGVDGYIFGVVIPAVLSAGQLFWFGTYLPHKQREGGYNEQRAVSQDFPRWLSYLTCYHFGYHYEHHAMPWVPWWKMPNARAAALRLREIK